MNKREQKKDIFLTKEGVEELKKRIKYLEEVVRKEIQEDIKTSLEHGDITENSEYNIAMEARRMNEINIVRLKERLSQVKVLDKENFSTDLSIGSTLILEDLNNNKQVKYTIVHDDQVDLEQGKIAMNSPIAQAFLDQQEGEEVKIKVPVGTLNYKILKIIK